MSPVGRVATRAAAELMWCLTCLQNGGVRSLVVGRDVEIREAGRGKGLGVFATRPIPAGTLVERYGGDYGMVEEFKAAGSSGKYAWQVADGWTIDAEDPKRSNWARYINHSVGRENCLAVPTDLPAILLRTPLPSPYAVWFETTRDIAPGEELLYDYGAAYWDPLTPLSRRLHAALPEGSPLYVLNARLNPKRFIIDWL